MATQYLSTLRFLQGKFLSLWENTFRIRRLSVESTHSGYKLISHPNAVNFRPGSAVGVFTDSKRNKHFIKDYAYTLKNLDYEYLHNEINTLKVFKSVAIPGLKVRMAQITESGDIGGRITLITKFAEGQTLDHFSKSTISRILIDVLSYLERTSDKLPKRVLNTIPKRQQLLTFLTFPFYLFRAVTKDHSQFKLLLKSNELYVKLAPQFMFRSFPYGINHRDLSVDNILYDRKTKYITILDTECMVRGDRLYDIALLPRLFIQYLDSNEFLSIFSSLGLSKSEMQRLNMLMIAGCVIKIATEQKGSRDYKNAVKGLNLVINSLIPKITQSTMNRKLHVTIGIPAFNEEANIGGLLDALYQQNRDSFILDKIIVVSDGSTDRTTKIVKSFSKRHAIVSCIADRVRRGVRYRTQQLMDKNKSEILVFFDGDTKPNEKDTLNRLVNVFKDGLIDLATANLMPVNPTTKFEYLLFSWRGLWSEVTHSWKEGNNIYNFRGVGIAIRKDFAKSVKIPKKITGASSHYLYLSAKKKSLKTAFVKTAVIKYRLAKSFEDYKKQLNRGQNDGHVLKSLFAKIYRVEYSIPPVIRLSAILKHGFKNPVGTFIGIVFNTIIQLMNREARPSDKNGIWEIAKSTKAAVIKI